MSRKNVVLEEKPPTHGWWQYEWEGARLCKSGRENYTQFCPGSLQVRWLELSATLERDSWALQGTWALPSEQQCGVEWRRSVGRVALKLKYPLAEWP